VSFTDCVLECGKNTELVEQFDRLTGSSLSKLGSRSGFDRMIDDATGYDRAQAAKFAAFVYETIWIRLPREAKGE